MKQVIIFAAVITVIGVVQCQNGIALIETFNNCIKENNGPPDLYQKLLKMKEVPITDRNSLCSLACVNLKTGLLTPQNKVDPEKLNAAISNMGFSTNSMTNIIQKCIPAVDNLTDKCDISGALIKCMAEFV